MRLYHPNQIHPSGNIDIIISAPEPARNYPRNHALNRVMAGPKQSGETVGLLKYEPVFCGC